MNPKTSSRRDLCVLTVFLFLSAFYSECANAQGISGDLTAGIRRRPYRRSLPVRSFPECDRDGNPMSVNNSQVVGWKTSTPNEYLDRARVSGVIAKVYHQARDHAHFSLKIGNDSEDTVEIIYNEGFGDLPELSTGSNVEACGDYITSFAATDQYPPSPDGALVHWVHRSTSPKHPSGYLAIDGEVYGMSEDAKE